MKCFENFIGIRTDCNFVPSTSGLYINDLEGINLETAAKIANINDSTGYELMKRKIKFGTELAINDLRTYTSPYININYILNKYSSGRNVPNSWLAPADAWRGAKVRLINKKGMEGLRIESIRVLAKESGSIKIKIIDGTENVRIINVDVTGGVEEEVQIGYVSYTDNVYILADNSNFSMSNGTFGTQTSRGCGCKGGGGGTGISYSGQNIEIVGWNGQGRDARNFGITINASTICSTEEILCSLKEDIKYIVLYKTGLELVKEWLQSRRINEYTTLGADQAAFLLQNWETEYQMRYKVFGENVKDLLSRIGGACVRCKGTGYAYQV